MWGRTLKCSIYCFTKYVLFLCLLVCQIGLSNQVTQCGNNDFFGEENPSNRNQASDNADNVPGRAYQMRGDEVTCCGLPDKFTANFIGVSPGQQDTIWYQIWRPGTGTSNYTLIAEYMDIIPNNNQRELQIADTGRPTIKSGDIFGWWLPGDDIVAYDTGGGGNNDFRLVTGDLNEGDNQDWSAAESLNNKYGLRFDVDANNKPNFTNLPNAIAISNEIAIGTSIFTISFTDEDPDDVTTLSVTMATHPDFTFNITSKIVTVIGTWSTSTSETLDFTVIDQCDNERQESLVVTVTNDPPVINRNPTAAYVSEDETSEQLLHTFNSTDAVSTPTCSKAAVSSSVPFIVRLKPSSTDYGIYCEASPGFDYDSNNQFNVTVECTDGEHVITEVFDIFLIKNQAPTFLNLQNATNITSSSSISGTAFTVLMYDPEGDSLTFSMTSDPSPCPFDIFNSGVIKITGDLTNLLVVGFELFINVSDGKNTVGPGLLTITITDVNFPVVISNLPLAANLSVPENTAFNIPVFTVSYQDLDTAQSHTFSMTASPGSGHSYFSINSTSGEISVSSLLNYEVIQPTTFSFSISVFDGVSSDTQTLNIDVIDQNEAPSFSQLSYSLSTVEGVAGDIIGTPRFDIRDPDEGDSTELTMDCGASGSSLFMNRTTGEVSYQSDVDLDVSNPVTRYNCTVTATDTSGLTDTASLFIIVRNINDNMPMCSPNLYTFYVSYYAPAGTFVGVITATDGDTGSYGVLTYSLNQVVLMAEYFSINSSGGISVAIPPRGSSALNFSTTVSIQVVVTDAGGLSDTATVIITIHDTTTVVTTTTTDRHRTFFEDTRNIPWISVCGVTILVIGILLTWVILTCRGERGCAQCTRTWCNKAKADNGVRGRYKRRLGPPPPKENQAWRADV